MAIEHGLRGIEMSTAWHANLSLLQPTLVSGRGIHSFVHRGSYVHSTSRKSVYSRWLASTVCGITSLSAFFCISLVPPPENLPFMRIVLTKNTFEICKFLMAAYFKHNVFLSLSILQVSPPPPPKYVL